MNIPAIKYLVSQLIILAVLFNAEAEFKEHVLAGGIRGAYNVQSLSFTDFDSDGDIDIIVPSEKALNWLENKGKARFEPHAVRNNAFAEHALPVDADGDGDCDIIRICQATDEIYQPIIRIDWLENKGNQLFPGRPFNITEKFDSDGNSNVAAGDIDSDGDIDFSITSGGPNSLYWFEHCDSGKFISHQVLSESQIPEGPICNVDIDSDNDIDLISGGDSLLIFFINDGHQNFIMDTISSPGAPWLNFKSVVPADIDRDNDLDIVTTMGYRLDWYENLGGLQFARHQISDSVQAESYASVADLDNDGDPDLVTASWLNRRLSWYENEGNQTFTPHVLSNNIYGPTAVYTIDIDADGDNDLFTTTCWDNVVSCFENKGNGQFITHILTTYVDSVQFLFAADMDNDGDKDIVADALQEGNIIWFEIVDSNNFRPHFISYDDNKLQSLALSDIDRDGDIDVIRPWGKLISYDNNGTGTFTPKILIPEISTVSNLSVRDTDGDGDIDIVASLPTDYTIVLYINDGNLQFSSDTLADSIFKPSSMQVIDFDKDGDLDIIAIQYYDKIGSRKKMVLYDNDGDWNMQPHILEESVIDFFSDIPADMDGDGDLDIIMLPGNPRLLTVLENTGNFNFIPDTTDLEVGGSIMNACDFDSDGDVDILAKIYRDNVYYIGWLENTGKKKYTVHIFPDTLTDDQNLFEIADIDNDGDTDLIAGSFYKGKLAWHENTGRLGIQKKSAELSPAIQGLSSVLWDNFAHSARVEFSFPVKAEIKVSLFDISGRSVVKPLKGTFTAGSHRIVLSPGMLPAGVYYVGLQSKAGKQFRKMMVIW